MQFDDRLATVLRSGAAGERAARTQFRQLLDLLGSTPPGANGPLVAAAYERLAEIAEILPAAEQSRILREPGLRLRNPRLVAHLAQSEPQVAAAAMAAARLGESDWFELIPELPVTARGFLRHRRDLPDSARRLLARLGVQDLVLPQPPGPNATVEPAPAPAAPVEGEANGGIGALVRRIEAFQKARRGSAAVAPRLPLDIGELLAEAPPPDAFDFSLDAAGRIDWAEAHVAPLLVGLRLTGRAGDPVCDRATETALRRRGVVGGGQVELPGADAVAGVWRVDAAPRFEPETGIYRGHAGRMRRPFGLAAEAGADTVGDRMRQVMHELRTPVNAIQGFAEIIQQQLFGPAPNTYRALAGAIGVDAARLLAGFDEIDRLARLESGALELSAEGCNFRVVVESTLRRLEGVTRPRSAHLRLLTSGEDFTVRLGEPDGALLAWRVLATLAGALAPGEVAELSLRGGAAGIALEAELPVGLAGEDDLFATAGRSEALAVTAGMFGTGFTLRLARAEAEAAGGTLAIHGETLALSLPTLTGAAPDHSQGDEGGSAAA
jgi:signal transduction histidine kinase